jgi:cobalamin biosynthesis protein CobW
LSEVFEDQISCADLILLTKSDLANSAAKEVAKNKISKIAPRPLPMIEISEGQVDPRVVLGLEAAAEDDLSSRPSHHDGVPDHDHEDFDSAVFSIDDLLSPDLLIDRVKRLADEEHILRVKGYAVVSGKPMRLLVQAVGSRVRTQYDRMWLPHELKQGQLVVIAEHDHLNPSAIEKILAS